MVNERFRAINLSRNPDVWQSVPAEEQYRLKNTTELLTTELELEQLIPNLYLDPAAEEKERKSPKEASCAEEKVGVGRALRMP